MNANRLAGQQQTAAGASAVPETRAVRMRAAIDKAVGAGPGFLRGETDADHMAHTMVGAVQAFVEHERKTGSDGVPHGAEERTLQNVLAELMTCGSGYLAGRCDAACVARTMTQMVREFPVR